MGLFFPSDILGNCKCLTAYRFQASLKKWLASSFNTSPLPKCLKIKGVKVSFLVQKEWLLIVKDDPNNIKTWEVICKFRKQAQRQEWDMNPLRCQEMPLKGKSLLFMSLSISAFQAHSKIHSQTLQASCKYSD